MRFPLFPEQVFDASLHTAILLGLLVTWATFELFGWAFAGFVVAGYTAVLAMIAPTVLAAVVIEAILTWSLAFSLTEGLPALGLYTRIFGRERFLLYVLTSLPVRVLVTGMVLPRWEAAYVGAGGDAASLGLGWFAVGTVLVPLMANALHKTGLVRGLLQLSVQAGLTWALLAGVLTPWTNFSVGTFSRTLDAVAFEPDASGRTLLVLVTTMFVAARANLRFGWDFGGILVPALVAVRFAAPVEIVVTLLEVITVYTLYRAVMGIPVLGKLDLEGPRRLVSIFAVAWAWKMSLAWVVSSLDLGWPVESMYGTGYLLTSLVVARALKSGSLLKTLVPLGSTALVGTAVAVPFALILASLPTATPARQGRGLRPPEALEDAVPFLALESAHRPAAASARLGPLQQLADDVVVRQRDGRACSTRTEGGTWGAPGSLFVIDCGGGGPWLWVVAPVGEPDVAWIVGNLAVRFPFSGVMVSAVDASRHPTQANHQAAIEDAASLTAVRVAGDAPLWRARTDGNAGVRFEPNDAQAAGRALTTLGLPDVALLPTDAAVPEALALARPQDGTLWLDRSAVVRLAETPTVDIHDERLLDVVLPAVVRGLDLPQDAVAPAWFYELADRAGVLAEDERVGDRQVWSLVRVDAVGAPIERWSFRPGGDPWTVMTADTVSFPGMRSVAAWVGQALDARVTWIGTPREPLPPTDVETLRADRPRLARMSRSLLAPRPGERAASRSLVVLEASREEGGPVWVSSGDEGTPRIAEPLWAALAPALAPWPTAARLDVGASEAAWHPTLTASVSYQRALYPDGAAVVWYPRAQLREVVGAPERDAWLAWWRARGVDVVVSSEVYDAALDAPAGAGCAPLEAWFQPPTEAGLARLAALGSLHAYADALRVVPRLDGCGSGEATP
jgi:hypothetical protein